MAPPRPLAPRPLVQLGGMPVDAVDAGEAVAAIVAGARSGKGGCVVTPNADILRQARRHPELADYLRRAELVLCDGMPLVWASRLQGTPVPCRVPMSRLVYPLAEAAAAAGLRLFLLGDTPEVTAAAGRRLTDAVPGLVIAGRHSPPFSTRHGEAELGEAAVAVERSGADVVLCAMGFPKQEQVMFDLHARLPRPWFLAVGGTLRMVAGHTPHAPAWMGRLGLEWLHRLRLEPRRLARRYLVDDLPFVAGLLLESAGTRLSAARSR